MKAPAKSPCGTCPYRRDVPSGVWHEEEYAKLPRYDEDTGMQPMGVFGCHQQDGHVCAGWAGCHDMEDNMALRIAVMNGTMSGADFEATLDYVSPVPLFATGAEAAEHGRARIAAPDDKAKRAIDRLTKKQAAVAGTKPRWVSCAKSLSWDAGRYRHLTQNDPKGWVTTVCGASGTPGSFRGNSTKPACPSCVKDA